MAPNRDGKLQEFITELSGFAREAESVLQKIENDPHGSKGEFENFSIQMLTIRGTALQLGFPNLAQIAGLGEEIAAKGPTVEKGSQIKKCVAALWDTLTTLKFLLENPLKVGTSHEEHAILKNRLESILRSMGGARESVSTDEIEKLLRGENLG